MRKISGFIFFLVFSNQLFCQDKIHYFLDSFLRNYFHEQEPGAFITIEDKGKIIFNKGYGLADMQTKRVIRSSTNFNIGSLTKQFTAYCILELAQQKKLSLDDKLIKYFPDFNSKIGNEVSIRQLLTHCSGLLDHYAYTDTNAIKHATDKDVLAAIKNVDSVYFTPGTQYRYSNTAYCLLALVIEKLGGTSYGEYIRKHIFIPLSMNQSTVFTMNAQITERALGYDLNPDKNQFNRLDASEAIFFSTEGDGGIYTSMDDYLKWSHAWQTGAILNKALIQKARSGQFVIDSAQGLSYGYGWFVIKKDTTQYIYHTGSNGGFRAIAFFIPVRNYSIVIFSNRTGVDLEYLVQEINKLFKVNNKYFIKIESLVSFIPTCPIFAPCKEITSFLTSFKKNLNASGAALN